MNTPVRIAGFAVGLAAVFGAAVGVGTAVGPVGAAATPDSAGSEHGTATGGHGQAAMADGADALPAGLMISEDGYTLSLGAATLPAGEETPLTFAILGPDAQPVTAFDDSHEEDMHLIAVRRDLSGFQHVHPDLGPDGVWRVPLALTPGAWRVFADFTPSSDGENRTLGADVAVPGSFLPDPVPAGSRTAEVDGYTVVLTGELVPGRESPLTLSISRDGRPVTDLQPYLAAYGHLVVLRAGDLAYLHVHPAGEPGSGNLVPGPHIDFRATTPSAGTYRLFLDFRHGDVVRTASFTVTTAAQTTAARTTAAHEEAGS
jgi:hypothetical protein